MYSGKGSLETVVVTYIALCLLLGLNPPKDEGRGWSKLNHLSDRLLISSAVGLIFALSSVNSERLLLVGVTLS